MKRFGEIPISPDDQPARAKKTAPEPEIDAGGEGTIPASEPEPRMEGQAEEPRDTSLSPRRIPARKKKPGKPARERSSTWRAALWLLLPLGLFLLYTVGSYLIVPFAIRGPLARTLGERLGRPVEIARAVFSPFTLRLFLEQITIGPAAGDRDGQKLMECARIDCHLTLDRISSGELVCEGIKVRDLVMRINRDAAISSDIGDTWRLIFPAPGKTSASLWPSWLLPGEITLTGGTVLIDDPAAQKQYKVEQIELYLPPLDPQQEDADRLPRLSAVINESPVQVEAVRTTGSGGQPETSFDLKIKDVVLSNYLQTLPMAERQLKLTEGRADLELRLIFPRTGEGTKRILLEGQSSLAAVKLVDADAKEVLSLPAAHLDFRVAPLAQRYRFSRIVLENPRFNLVGKGGEEKISGLTPGDLVNGLLLPVRTPLNLGIEKLELTGGQVRLALPAAKKELVWDEVNATLDNFTSPGVGLEEKKGGSSRFSFKAVDGSGSKPAQLSSTGEILPDGEVVGQADIDQVDVTLYRDLLAPTGLSLTKGRGEVHFFYESEFGKSDQKKGEGTSFRVRDGELKVADYALSVLGKKGVAGGSMKCAGLQVVPAEQRLVCSSLEFADSEIFRPAALAGIVGPPPAKDKSWHLVARDLQVKGSRVHVELLQTWCAAESDLLLKNFSLDAKGLDGQSPAGNNITAQGKIGNKGTLKVDGRYTFSEHKGNLQLDLQHLDLSLFNPCFAGIVIPEVRQGSVNIQGNVALPAKEFSGQVWAGEMVAGEEKGPSLSWQLATSDRVTLRTEPLHLDLGEIMVNKPVVQPGLVDSENLLGKFLQPGKPSFKNLAIGKISFDDGQISPIWPILLPGYQPRLEGISGSISSLGADTMPFSLAGKVADLGSFTLSGNAGMERVESYALKMAPVSLTPFADFFLTQMGMDIESAKGEWQQKMSRADNVMQITTTGSFQGLQPLAESPMLRVASLLLGEKGALQVESEEGVAVDAEPAFLLTSAQRYLQRQAVRADISEELVLRDEFPKLQLPGEISFAPGQEQANGLDTLAGYKEVLARRPFLLLRLQAVIDEETDREALRQVLQDAADRQREAENSRRALVKLQREEREKERLAAIKAGRTPVVAEKIEEDELNGDLEPLPYVAVEVTGEQMAELAKKRIQAVQRHLLSKLSIHPAKVQVAQEYDNGAPQVRLRLEPDVDGGGR